MLSRLENESRVGNLISPESLNLLRRDAEALRLRITDLGQEIKAHEQSVASLKQQKAEFLTVLGKIEALLSQDQGIAEVLPDLLNSSNSLVSYATDSAASVATDRGGNSLAELIEGVMRSAGTPLHYKEILNRLQSQESDVGGKDPAATLLSILASKRYAGRFARTERGVYTLSTFLGPQVIPRSSKRQRRRAKPAKARGNHS